MPRILALVLAALCAAPAATFAQSMEQHHETQSLEDLWTGLRTLPVGTRLRLTLNDGAELEGQLVEWQSDALVLQNSQLKKGQFLTPARTLLTDRLTFSHADIASVVVPGREPVPFAHRLEVAAGVQGVGDGSAKLSGWSGEMAINLAPRASLVGKWHGANGTEKSLFGGPGAKWEDRNAAGGIRYNWRLTGVVPFVQFMGGAYSTTTTKPAYVGLRGPVASERSTRTQFGFQGGGGVTVPFAPHVAGRVAADAIIFSEGGAAARFIAAVVIGLGPKVR